MGGDGEHVHTMGGGAECTMCPICVLYQALSSTRPEVTAHLLAAGRELSAALRVAVDAHVERAGDAAERAGRPVDELRRIRVE